MAAVNGKRVCQAWRQPSNRFVWLLGVLLCCGCSSHVHRLQQSRAHYLAGDLESADELLQKELDKRHRGDADVMSLDLAMVRMCQGRPAEAEQLLRTVRDRFETLEQESLAESVAAVLADDQQRAYAGEDYEKILIRVFLALSNMLQDGSDSAAYSLQINQKQQQLLQQSSGDDAAIGLPGLAMGSYLRGVLSEATHRDYDDAVRAYEQVLQWQPGLVSVERDLQRVLLASHSQPGNGVLYVFAMVDRGPIKVEQSAEATSEALLIADRILSSIGKHQLPPTIAPVKIPVVQLAPPEIQALEVAPDGLPPQRTETICDVADLAVRCAWARRSETIARAVVRRVAKKSLVYTAQEQFAANNAMASLAMTAAGVAWEATEAADTRCWGMLPRAIQVCRLELPAGEHSISCAPISVYGQRGQPARRKVTIVDGRNTYLWICFPGPRPVGSLVTNSP